MYFWQLFESAGVDVAVSVFFRHQDSTIVWLVTDKIVTDV
jgi:hypothetical protein